MDGCTSIAGTVDANPKSLLRERIGPHELHLYRASPRAKQIVNDSTAQQTISRPM